MKFPFLIAATLATAMLSGCIYLNSKDDSLYQAPIPHYQHALSRNISFSVNMRTIVHDWFSYDDAKKIARERLEKSGLFDSVYYAELKDASCNHIHFDFELSSSSETAQTVAGLSIGTLTLLPGWTENRLHSTASLYIDGKEQDCYHDQRMGKVYIWFPLILGAPFLNSATTGSDILEDTVDALLEQVRTYRR